MPDAHYFKRLPQESSPEGQGPTLGIRQMSEFLKALDASETPFTHNYPQRFIFQGPPNCCYSTIREHVEPYRGWWLSLKSVIDEVTPDEEDEWIEWEPSPRLREIMDVADEMESYTYRVVPNPAYDEEKCEKWHESHQVNQRKVEWGQSEVPDELAQKYRDETLRQERVMECMTITGQSREDCEADDANRL